jgi:hypothetical protein
VRWADEPKIPSTMGLGRPPSPAHVRSRPETTRGVSPECPLSFHRSNPGVATGPASRPRCRCTRRLGHGTTEQKRGLSARLRKPRWAAARRDVGTRPLPRWVQAARRKRHEPCVCAGPSRGTRPPTRRRGRSRRLRTRSRCSPRSRPHRREVLGRLLLPAEAVVSSWSDGLVIRQPTRAGRRQRHARHEPTHTRAGRPPARLGARWPCAAPDCERHRYPRCGVGSALDLVSETGHGTTRIAPLRPVPARRQP